MVEATSNRWTYISCSCIVVVDDTIVREFVILYLRCKSFYRLFLRFRSMSPSCDIDRRSHRSVDLGRCDWANLCILYFLVNGRFLIDSRLLREESLYNVLALLHFFRFGKLYFLTFALPSRLLLESSLFARFAALQIALRKFKTYAAGNQPRCTDLQVSPKYEWGANTRCR